MKVSGVEITHSWDGYTRVYKAGDTTLMYFTVKDAFNCCGAQAVSKPWLACSRVFEKAGVDRKALVNAAIQNTMTYLTISALVQVDHIGSYATDEEEFAMDDRGPWYEIVDLWDGQFLQVPNPFQNISEGDTALCMFAFINQHATVSDEEHSYKQS